jgi:hypothetical protein
MGRKSSKVLELTDAEIRVKEQSIAEKIARRAARSDARKVVARDKSLDQKLASCTTETRARTCRKNKRTLALLETDDEDEDFDDVSWQVTPPASPRQNLMKKCRACKI